MNLRDLVELVVMSGGSYNYASSKVDEISAWASTLEDMAARCRRWAIEIQEVDVKAKTTPWKKRPVTMDDRARLIVHAMRLERAANKIRDAHLATEELAELMHAVEWVASGDDVPGDLLEVES